MADENLVLREGHLSQLHILLKPVKASTRQLYIALGYDPADLDDIEAAPENTIHHLFTYLLEQITCDDKTTKEKVVAALRSEPVGHGQAATKLENDGKIKNGVLKREEHLLILATLLQPAIAQTQALAIQLGVDLAPAKVVQRTPFTIMIHAITHNKTVTVKKLAEALQNQLVGHGALARKLLNYDFGEQTIA